MNLRAAAAAAGGGGGYQGRVEKWKGGNDNIFNILI